MRPTVEIDDALLAEAMAATGLESRREVMEAGLRLLVRQKRQAEARQLLGRIQWEGALHRERLDGRRLWVTPSLRSVDASGRAAAAVHGKL